MISANSTAVKVDNRFMTYLFKLIKLLDNVCSSIKTFIKTIEKVYNHRSLIVASFINESVLDSLRAEILEASILSRVFIDG